MGDSTGYPSPPREPAPAVPGGLQRLLNRRSAFALPLGRNFVPGSVRGYPIDFTEKTTVPEWPPPWFPVPPAHLFIDLTQWALGAFERHLAGEGERWLEPAIKTGEFMLERQERDGRRAGAWLEPRNYRHTYHVQGPWVSAMAQGQSVSLLVRLAAETGRADFADAAVRGLRPMQISSREGGAAAPLGGELFPEEFPTDPPSFVLNGAIFAFWGYYDVAAGLGDETARTAFESGVTLLAENINRWDTGSWSRYDLYPHPVLNVANASYHALHVKQLRLLDTLAPRPQLRAAAETFERYAASPTNRRRALARKVAFRLVIPRNHLLAGRLPWDRATGPQGAVRGR